MGQLSLLDGAADGTEGDLPPCIKTAIISPCGTYRYTLSRVWGDGRQVVFIMLNPSTADADHDDRTVRRCIGFTRGWGFGGFSVVNLFALRSTDPRALLPHVDPIGPDNDRHIEETVARVLAQHGLLVVAWGGSHLANKSGRERFGKRAEDVLRLLSAHADVHCFGRTADGVPKHPLYLAGETRLELFRPKGA